MSWIKTQLGKLGVRLIEVAYPSGAIGSSYDIQYPVLIPLKVIYEKISKSTNRYQTYRLLREVDSELYGAIDRVSKMVRSSYAGFHIKTGEEVSPSEQELLDELKLFEKDFKIKNYYSAISTLLLTYGDALFINRYDQNVGLVEFKSLPIEYMTVVENRNQIGDITAQIFEPNFYILNELSENSTIFSGDDIIQFTLGVEGSTVNDLVGRYTYGVWAQSPVESLRAALLWKLSLRLNDMLLRNHMVPRQHHKLNLEGFVPQNYPGDTVEERYAAAKAAAEAHINAYKNNVATPMKEADKSIITGNDVEIGYVEPAHVTYVDPNPLIDEINKSIWASIAPIEAAVTARGARSYAAELVISSYSQLIAETVADFINEPLLGVARKHIETKFGGQYNEELDKLYVKSQFIMGIERGERIRQGAVMYASNSITPDEFRDLVGLDPLTEKQKQQILEANMVRTGRTGQFDRTTGDVMSDYIRRTDSDSRNPATPQSRKDRQQT